MEQHVQGEAKRGRAESGARAVGEESKVMPREPQWVWASIIVPVLVALIYVVGGPLVQAYRGSPLPVEPPASRREPTGKQAQPDTASTPGTSLTPDKSKAPVSTLRGESARIWLRSEHRVRSLTPEESALSVREAPRGIYGFYSASGTYGLTWITANKSVADARDFLLGLPLNRVHNKEEDFEYHKLQDGSVVIGGFVGRESASDMRLDFRPPDGLLRIRFYNFSWDGGHEIAILRHEDVTQASQRRIQLDKGRGPIVLDLRLR